MPHPHVLSRPRAGALAARLLLAAALIAGLLGMHVMMAPGAHSAHDASSVAMGAALSAHDDAAEPQAVSQGLDTPCAPTGCAGALPESDADVWAVVSALALLLTALLAARPVGIRRAPRRASARVEVGRVAVDRGLRHPPSLIVLSISRT